MTQRGDFKPQFGDVSIYDYANASVTGRKGRLSKKVFTPIIEAEKWSKKEDGLCWEQRQQRLDDRDSEDVEIGLFWNQRVFLDKIWSKHPGKKTATFLDSDHDTSKPFLLLPMDIWFAIGDHIPPESVKAFASICKSTQKVTNSARFWFGLYKRHYKPANLELLPMRLQPKNMTAIHGLKACVIRSLFLIYPPFIERLKPRIGNECDLQPILRRKCVSTWYSTKGKIWTYWFKFKKINPRAGRNSSLYSFTNKKLLQMEQDMAANEEKDTKVLQVSSSQYIPLPAVHGLILKRAIITVSLDMMSNKITLAFESENLVFDPASSIQVLDWWHPQYPHASHEAGRKKHFGSFSCDKDRDDFQVGVLIDHWYDV